MTKQPPAKPADELKPLLPLEYCRIDRAARLLGCEVGDLIHWAATGLIDFFVMGKSIHHDFGVGGLFISCPYEEFGKFDMKYGASFEELDERERDFMKFDGLTYFENVATLQGFWALNPEHLKEWEETGSLEYLHDSGFTLHAYFDGSPELVVAFMADIPSVMDKVWVMADDLEKLYGLIHCGRSQHADYKDIDAISVSTKRAQANHEVEAINKYKERHASTRELILAAAIRAKIMWPNECENTATAWAKTICDHEAVLFSETANKKAPLSTPVIEKILSSAMNKGLPHKSK